MATKKSAPQDAIALLKADHRKVEDLFEKYEKSRGKKAEIARQICLELTVHATIEEEIFYPACKEAVEDDKLDEAYVEHDGAKVLIAEISNGSPEDEFYDAKVKVLSEEIKHHVKEEEQRDGIFAQAKASKLDLKALGAQLAARKKELMAKLIKEALPPPLTRTMKDCKIDRGAPVN
jgi:hypothetical protein